jgi:hypothetical protein
VGTDRRVSLRPTVKLDVVRGTLHTQQILAGFLMLARAGEFELRVRLLPPSGETCSLILTATVDGRRVGYDMRGGIIDLDPAVGATSTRWTTSSSVATGRTRTARMSRWSGPLAVNCDAPLESIAAVDASRAAAVRTLRAGFGQRFIRRFQPTPYARANFPDCVIDARIVRRRRYLQLMKQASVCIATRGLHQSNGWKLAEYVAASKPIVAEPLSYAVPGDFAPGTNYLEFRNPDALVAAVQELLADTARPAGSLLQTTFTTWLRSGRMPLCVTV